MNMSVLRVGLFGIGCIVMMGAAATGWRNPSCPRTSPGHTNSLTCNTEVCKRCCRGCCLHFHPDNTSQEFGDCELTCRQLNDACTGELQPGGPGGVP